jgi:hypothetical protein
MGDILPGKKSPWTPVRRTVNEWGTNKRIQTADGGRQTANGFYHLSCEQGGCSWGEMKGHRILLLPV